MGFTNITYSIKGNGVLMHIKTNDCPSWCKFSIIEILAFSKTAIPEISQKINTYSCSRCRSRADYIVNGFRIIYYSCSECYSYIDCANVIEISSKKYFLSNRNNNFRHDITVDIDKSSIEIIVRESFCKFIRGPHLLSYSVHKRWEYHIYHVSARQFIIKLIPQYTLLPRELFQNNDVAGLITVTMCKTIGWRNIFGSKVIDNL